MSRAIAINTESLGRLTWTQYNKLVREHGSQAALAEDVGVSPSTVRTWGDRLRQVRASR